MSDCHVHFLAFEYEITPSLGELERSLDVRRRARKAIASHCATLGARVRFHPQGSFRLLTAVRRDGLDLDDGVLFRNGSFAESPSVETLHEIIFDALRVAGFLVIARQPCLRILHSRGVRVDIVAYLEDSDGRIRLAHHKDGWVAAHSSHLIAWFEDPMDPHAAGQIRRLIKYYKVWAARMAPIVMPSGVALTILIKTLHCSDARDDVALTRTMKRTLEHLEAGNGCRRPTPPVGQELLKEELTAGQFDRFLVRLRDFVKTAETALSNENLERAVCLWQSLFGPSFGGIGYEVTPEDRRWQLRRILEDFEGFSTRKTDRRNTGKEELAKRWTL